MAWKRKVSGKERHRAKLLAWILLFFLFFSGVTLLIILTFNPHKDPHYKEYALMISGLVLLRVETIVVFD